MRTRPDAPSESHSGKSTHHETGGWFDQNFRNALLMAVLLATGPACDSSKKDPSPTNTETTIQVEPEKPAQEPIDAPHSTQAHQSLELKVPAGLEMEAGEFEKMCKTIGKQTQKRALKLEKDLDANPEKRDDLVKNFLKESATDILKNNPNTQALFDELGAKKSMENTVKFLNTFLRPGGYYFHFITRGEYLVGLSTIESTDSLNIGDNQGTLQLPIYILGEEVIKNEAYPESTGATADPDDDAILIFGQRSEDHKKAMKTDHEEINKEKGIPFEEAEKENDRLQIHHEGVHILLRKRYPQLNGSVLAYNLPIEFPVGDKTTRYKQTFTNEMLTELASVGAELAELEKDLPTEQLSYLQASFTNPKSPYHLALLALMHYSIDEAQEGPVKKELNYLTAKGEMDVELFIRLIQEQKDGLAYRKRVGDRMYALAIELLEKTKNLEPPPRY